MDMKDKHQMFARGGRNIVMSAIPAVIRLGESITSIEYIVLTS